MTRRRSDTKFWERFTSSVSSYRYLPEVIDLVLSMAALLFGAPLPSEVTPFLSQKVSPVASLWPRHFGTDWALTRFPGSKLSLFLHREFVDDASAWRELKHSRLFPFHRPARVVEARGPTRTSRWSAKRDQWRFVWARMKFHLAGLVGYAFHWPRWNRVLCRTLPPIANRPAPIQGWSG